METNDLDWVRVCTYHAYMPQAQVNVCINIFLLKQNLAIFTDLREARGNKTGVNVRSRCGKTATDMMASHLHCRRFSSSMVEHLFVLAPCILAVGMHACILT